VANKTNNVGVTLLITNAAADVDLPAQTLTFTTVKVPTGATVDPSSGVLNWRPLVSQAGTSNTFSVRVTDNGIPNLSVTNNFNVFVNPVTNPHIDSISLAGGHASLTASGPTGPDYTLWTSTNLFDWETLFTTNSPLLPVTLVDTNSILDPARFYRIQIGP